MAILTRGQTRAGGPPDSRAAGPAWHTLTAEEACAELRTDGAAGLASDEAARRLVRHGRNALREAPPRSAAAMLAGQFADFMIGVLVVAAAISGLLGEIGDTLAIVAIVVLNALIGFAQEYRAERAMAALRRLAAGTAQVVRGGQPTVVPTEELVPGDLVLLEAGNLVPADLRLVAARSLRIDESLLTGESVPVDKDPTALPQAALPLGDRTDMAYKGAMVTHGRGRGIVVATGMATELGRIARLLEAGVTPRTPLQQRLAAFGRRLGVAVLAICALVFALGLVRGEPSLPLFLTAVSLAVAAIPEAMPAVVTIALALGAAHMARANALVRRLPAVETLGSVTVICSDKTGTLTQNRMQVAAIAVADGAAVSWTRQERTGDIRSTWPGPAAGGAAPPGKAGATPEHEAERERGSRRALFTALALCNDATRNQRGELSGDPTEVALAEAAAAAGFERQRVETQLPRVGEWPFDPARQRMTTLHAAGEARLACTKGAPERVLPLCAGCGMPDPTPLDTAAVLATAERMAGEGLRVLAVAVRQIDAGQAADSATMVDADQPTDSAASVECELVFVGLVGLIDPPRPEATEAVAQCRTAGIVPVMITGDHPATALAVARATGIAAAGDQVLGGAALAAMSDAEFEKRAPGIRVYARVDPEQKIRIVEALQRNGAIVAMTGDGVNDAPALKRADIGVAMGRGGTDVAREAASLILLDDNFATIVAAVRAGRRIYDNIRKFIRFVMTGNAGEIWTIVAAPLLGLPLPLLPIQILWINLVTDGLPGLALAAEPAERGVMKRPPRPPLESVFAHGLWQHVVWVGLLIGAVSLLAQFAAQASASTHGQTMVFTVLTLAQLVHVLAIRSETTSLFALGLGSNRPLLVAVVLGIGLQLATIYVPIANTLLHTTPLTLTELGLCGLLALTVFIAVEIEKWAVRHRWLYVEKSAARAHAAR